MQKGFNEALRRLNADMLKTHFHSDGMVSGMRSIHGPLVDMAMSGGGLGARNAEKMVTTQRFSRRDKANEQWLDGIVAKHRTVHAALGAIDSHHRNVLTAAYGEQRRWSLQVQKALRDNLPVEYRDAFGAALLTPRVQNGMNTHAELEEEVDTLIESKNAEVNRRRRAKAVTGVLLWSPPKSAFKRGGDIEKVAALTAEWLKAAHLAFAKAMGQLDAKPSIKKRATLAKTKPVAPYSAGAW